MGDIEAMKIKQPNKKRRKVIRVGGNAMELEDNRPEIRFSQLNKFYRLRRTYGVR